MPRWKKLCIIAGGGDLPGVLTKAAIANNATIFLVRLVGYADEQLKHYPGVDCGLGEAGKILQAIKVNECDALVFAGNVKRPDFQSLKVDWRGAKLLPRLAGAAMRGDGALLRAVVEIMEDEGLMVVGAEAVMQSLAAPGGTIGLHAPDDENRRDIQKAAAILDALGPFDIAQGVVIANGHVLALEAAEGTDLMLERCASLPVQQTKSAGGVLVKRPKSGQELRVDLPVIGLETVKRASRAGLSGIAVEAQMSLILDQDDVIAFADANGLFLYGFTPDELDSA